MDYFRPFEAKMAPSQTWEWGCFVGPPRLGLVCCGWYLKRWGNASPRPEQQEARASAAGDKAAAKDSGRGKGRAKGCTAEAAAAAAATSNDLDQWLAHRPGGRRPDGGEDEGLLRTGC